MQSWAKYSMYSIWNTKYKILHLKYLKYQNTNTFLQVFEIPNTKYYFQNTENTKYWDPKIFWFLFCVALSYVLHLCIFIFIFHCHANTGEWCNAKKKSTCTCYSLHEINDILHVMYNCNVQCVQKKRDQNVFVISSIKLGRFWWNLVCTFLNKFAANMCKHFPPHLNNVPTLYLVKLEVHHAGATTVLSEKETPKLILSQLWPPNSPDLNPVDYSVWEYCKRRCTKHASIWMNWNSDWKRRGPSWIMFDLSNSCGSKVVWVMELHFLQNMPAYENISDKTRATVMKFDTRFPK